MGEGGVCVCVCVCVCVRHDVAQFIHKLAPKLAHDNVVTQ